MTQVDLGRRQALALLGGVGAAISAACSGDAPSSPTRTSSGAPTGGSTGGTGTSNATCAVTPAETAGPFPSLTDMFRSDIRESSPGIPLVLTIKVVNVNAACAPVAGAAVEIWQCDIAGNYSQYGSVSQQTFLRGIQVSNAAGDVTFTTVYPGWYQGRATHIHVEVSMGGRSVRVSQIAFPESISNQVHTTGVYASRGVNPTTNARDGIFADSLDAELVTPTGSPTTGYTASWQFGIPI